MQIRPTYHSRTYRDFLAIEPKDYHGLIRFYEEREQQIGQLDEEEQHTLLFVYTNALFEVGAYRQFLAITDQAILGVLEPTCRMPEVDKQLLFEKLLFRKAAAYLHTLEPAQAEHVVKELLRIAPRHEMAKLLLRKSLRLQDTSINTITRAGTILLLALSALVILGEVLLIRNFYDRYTSVTELTRNLLFLAALLLLVFGEVITRWRAHRTAQDFMADREPD
jgi:hypothetical protein